MPTNRTWVAFNTGSIAFDSVLVATYPESVSFTTGFVATDAATIRVELHAVRADRERPGSPPRLQTGSLDDGSLLSFITVLPLIPRNPGPLSTETGRSESFGFETQPTRLDGVVRQLVLRSRESVDAHLAPSAADYRGFRPNRAELAVVPDAVLELHAFSNYASVFGMTAPSGRTCRERDRWRFQVVDAARGVGGLDECGGGVTTTVTTTQETVARARGGHPMGCG